MSQQVLIKATAVGGGAVTGSIMLSNAGVISTDMWALRG